MIKDAKGGLTVDITQSGNEGDLRLLNIEINDLSSLIGELQYFYQIMNVVTPMTPNHINEGVSQKIVDYYFKNVKVAEIARVLGISKSLVKAELIKQGVEITDKYSGRRRWYYRRKKK